MTYHPLADLEAAQEVLDAFDLSTLTTGDVIETGGSYEPSAVPLTIAKFNELLDAGRRAHVQFVAGPETSEHIAAVAGVSVGASPYADEGVLYVMFPPQIVGDITIVPYDGATLTPDLVEQLHRDR